MRWICLLRGVNVSGKNKLNMAELRQRAGEAGLSNCQTYIQSGNFIFDSPVTDAGELENQIEQWIRTAFQLDILAFCLTPSRLRQIIQDCPIQLESEFDGKLLHTTLLKTAPVMEPDFHLPVGPREEWQLRENAMYLYCPDGYGKTKLTPTLLERKFKTPGTTRNWNTLMALSRLAES